jgi:glycosyltransferase involved in cell wall biosynthesis
VQDTAAYYAIADVVVLPSHREGLPTVVLEAHAAGKPVVGASTTGIVDIVVDGETGLLFPVGDVTALGEALTSLLSNNKLADKIASAGQDRVQREFRQEKIWEALYREYLRFLQMRDLALPLMPRVESRSGSGDEARRLAGPKKYRGCLTS